jgi:hypothetical protein
MDAYIFDAELLCSDCAESVMARLPKPVGWPDEYQYDSDDYPKGPYSDGGGEADCPNHCGICGLFLENPLTDDGAEYVKAAIAEFDSTGRGTPEVIAEWREFYAKRSN